MPRVVWIHADLDPLRSGELRRLGLPALLSEADGWDASFIHAGHADSIPPADLVVLPLDALNALPTIARRGCATILVEVDTRWIDAPPSVFEALRGLRNRIAGVVARGPRAAAWAGRAVGPGVAVWTVPDCAARAVELAAVAVRFDIAPPSITQAALPPAFELWFAEPGDRIEHDEAEALERFWRPESGNAVVVGSAETRAWLAQIGLKFSGLDWSPQTVASALVKADRVVFFGGETYSQSRRRATALRGGGAAAISRILDREIHSPAMVGRGWIEVLSGMKRQPVPLQGSGAVMVLLDLIQDLDIALPFIDRLLSRDDLELRVVVSTWLDRRSPRVGRELADRNLTPIVCKRDLMLQSDEPPLEGVGALVTFAESSLPAHERAHALVRRARDRQIATFNFQHGVENVGLIRLDHDEVERPTLLSDHIFVWGGETAGESASPEVRPRLVPVGRVAAPIRPALELRGALTTFKSIVAVFENLHWSRYDNAWRRRFLADCVEFAATNPERAVVIKPHHAGLWTVRNMHQVPQWPSNLVLADPTDPFWEPFTAPSILAFADLVITTPSTVALDAVQAGKRVAVAAYGLELPAYDPLPLLHSIVDWQNFAHSDGLTDEALRRASFLVRSAVGDDPAGDAMAYLMQAMRERARARQASDPKLEDVA
jgi:hypothetical protein